MMRVLLGLIVTAQARCQRKQQCTARGWIAEPRLMQTAGRRSSAPTS